LGIGEYLHEQNVGGSMLGLRVGADGVIWQPDINYLMYNDSLINSIGTAADGSHQTPPEPQRAAGFMRTFVHEGTAYARSSVLNGTLVFQTPMESIHGSAWVKPTAAESWGKRIVEPGQFWVLLSLERRAVFVFIGDRKQGTLRVAQDGEMLRISIEPKIRSMLVEQLLHTREFTVVVDGKNLTFWLRRAGVDDMFLNIFAR
jgi:hypothetical protein